MTKKIFVTGGAGFIGSHIVKYFLDKGDEVWTVDNMQSGKASNIEPFKGNPAFRFDQADLRDWPKLQEAVAWADRIFHMAATVGQRLVLSNPLNTLMNNLHSTERLLEAMVKAKSKARILLASTSSVYIHCPLDPDGTIRETAMVRTPSGGYLQESYPVSKLVDEIMALDYVHLYDLHCTIVRIFNTIGINQSPAYGFVVPTFIGQALDNKPLTVYGDGLQTRSFSNACDNVRAFDLLLEHPESKGQIVNIGDDRECSILDLAKLVLKLSGSRAGIKFVSYQEAYGVDFQDVRSRRPNLEKLRKMIGFKPQWTLEQTIKEILNHVATIHR